MSGYLNGSQPPSSQSGIANEHRMTVVEMRTEQQQKTLDHHHDRISYLERAVQALMYGMAVLGGIKGDSILDILSKVAK